MKTTLSRFTRLSILLGIALILTITIGFAKTKKTKRETASPTQSIRIVGLVEQVNKDRSFDLVSLDGQRYHVQMPEDAMVNAFGASLRSKHFLRFNDLYSGARISFSATSKEATYAVNGK